MQCCTFLGGIFNYLNWPSFHWAGVYRLNPIVYQKCTVMQSNDVKCVCVWSCSTGPQSLSESVCFSFSFRADCRDGVAYG